MFSSNPVFLGQVPIVGHLGITAEEYARELQERRRQLEPPSAPSPRRHVSCIPSYLDSQARNRICQVLDALDSATPGSREQELYRQEFDNQWNQLLEGQKDCMEEWIKNRCPQLNPQFNIQRTRQRPPVPSTYRFAPRGATMFQQALPPPPPPRPPQPSGAPVPSVDIFAPPGTVKPLQPIKTSETGMQRFQPAECLPGYVLDTSTGECVPQPVPTGYRSSFSTGLFPFALGPGGGGGLVAPTLGIPVVNLTRL